MRTILYAVTDRRRLHLDPAGVIERVGWLAAAGVDMIQIRERDLADSAVVALVRAAVAAVGPAATRVLVNDRADLAIAARAHGVHLRGDSIAARRVRAIAPAPFVIGRSVHTMAEAIAAEQDGGCDFVLFGTVFPSRGKPADHPLAGIEGLRHVCGGVAVPVVAIGGIDARSASAVVAAGASGIAGIDVFFDVRSEAQARERVAALRDAFDSRSVVV